MNCTYTYNGKSYEGYDALVAALEADDISTALSMLFSLETSKQQTTYDQIDKLRKDYKLSPYALENSSYSALSGDPDIQVDKSKYFTTQTFIDSGYCMVNGEPPILRLNTDEFLQAEKDFMIKNGATELEAQARCEKIRDNDERIAKDAYDLHRIIVSSNSNEDDRHFSGAALNTSFSGIYDQLGPLSRQIWKDIFSKNAGSMPMRNINLMADIKGVAEKIIGHIDYLQIKEDGTIEIFNLKMSTQTEPEWNPVKKEKFKLQLALIKRILEFNGIDSRRIRVNIIPVRMKYDEDFENILEISAGSPIAYDQKEYQYTFQKYDNIANNFIDSNVSIEDLDDSIYDTVQNNLNKIFVGRDVNITAKGIKESAKHWINNNWKYIASYAQGKPGWEIKLPGTKESIYIADTRVGDKNEELVKLVASKEHELFKNSAYEKGTYRLVQDIEHSYKHKYTSLLSSGKTSPILDTQLSKYFEQDTKGEYKWELVKNQELLTNANVILFRHKDSDQLDVFSITPFDISIMAKANNRDNLLGAYIPDLNSYNFTMRSNYGNIEAIKALTLLNEVVPKLSFQPKLGQLKIVSLNNYRNRKGCEFEMQSLLPEFDKVVRVVNDNNKGFGMVNRFKEQNVSTIDPARIFIQTWKEAISDNPTLNLQELKGLDKEITQKVLTDGTVIDGLESLKTSESKIEKLEIIIKRLTDIAEQKGISLSATNLIKQSYSANKETAAISKAYMAAVRALNMYNGDLSIDNEEFSQMEEYFMKSQSIANTNVRTVGYMFQKSINKIADQVLDRYAPIRDIIMKYYKDCGYSSFQNSTIGNQAKQFENLYEIKDGVKTMRFKNPYDLMSDLKDYERQFLKDILWEFNKIRFEMRGQEWKYSGKNDQTLINDINHKTDFNYLDVPLERASNATRRANIKNGIKEFGRRWMKRIMHPKEAFQEFTDDLLNEEEKQLRDQDISNLQAYNPFRRSEMVNSRANYIISKGVDYFETNVENIMIDFLEKHLQSVEYNKMLTRTKGILLDLHLRGETGDDPKAVEHTVKTIEDFLSVNVFNKSIMEESSQAIEGVLEPIRRAVSKCYIAANPVAAVRDTIQGLLENTVRSLTKFQTDIDVKDVMYGYKQVITEGPTSPMTIAKLNQLNVKYRFSNLDVARISEGQKTGRSGILNADNWAYATLRGPDYLNRMVLFSARMHHDGVDDAYFIKEGKLVYDYTKDKRFSAYVKNDTSDPKLYAKQRSLYLSLLRAFNQENGTSLVEGDALPDAYTLQQIQTFKTFADNIYGSYNQSTRAKYENTAIGRNFAVFSTWMNGIVDVYTKRRQISEGESKWEQETNANGEPLYFDKYGNVLTLAEGGDVNTPVMKDVPIMVQGVWWTLVDSFKELKGGGWNSFKSNIWNNEVNRRNYRRLFTDMLVAAILGAMFKFFLDDEYKEYKKTADGNDIITNAIVEVLYKSSSSCFDGFKGPFAVLEYFGESTNPATYTLATKVLNDTYNFIFGEKTLADIAMNSVALPRAFGDTYKMWAKEN